MHVWLHIEPLYDRNGKASLADLPTYLLDHFGILDPDPFPHTYMYNHVHTERLQLTCELEGQGCIEVVEPTRQFGTLTIPSTPQAPERYWNGHKSLGGNSWISTRILRGSQGGIASGLGCGDKGGNTVSILQGHRLRTAKDIESMLSDM